MDFVKLERRLERAFTGKPVQVGAGSIVWRRRPVLLWQLVADSLDEEERQEAPDLQAWPGNVSDLLGARDRALLGFYWDGFGPTSFVAGITLLELQRSSYLCHWDELQSYRAVAKLEGWRNRPVLRDAVRELLRRNGHPHGLSVFGSLPTETTNYAVRLIPTATVKQAYFDWLQADPWGNGDTWSELAQEHCSRTRRTQRPHSLARLPVDPADARRHRRSQCLAERPRGRERCDARPLTPTTLRRMVRDRLRARRFVTTTKVTGKTSQSGS